jgi:hypothetical protein
MSSATTSPKNLLQAKPRRGETRIPPEAPRPDPMIAKLGAIRDHRLHKAEIELAQARSHASAMRSAMREAFEKTKEAQETAKIFWLSTMQKFRAMELTLTEFLGCKSRHIKLQRDIQAFKNDAKRAVGIARAARQGIRDAQFFLKAQQMGVEKFRLMRELEKEETQRQVIE